MFNINDVVKIKDEHKPLILASLSGGEIIYSGVCFENISFEFTVIYVDGSIIQATCEGNTIYLKDNYLELV